MFALRTILTGIAELAMPTRPTSAWLFTPKLEEESQGLKSSQDHVIKESIMCRSVSADSNTKLELAFFR